MTDLPNDISPGTLYVVATPIGNPDDITLRALKVLAEVEIIAAEDTRDTGRLLKHHGITGRLIAYHDHNEKNRATELVQRLRAGASVAVVSDAGTPTVSDPGYRLVTAALEAGLRVVPVPGVSAAVTALSVSGLATDAFSFIGFAPRKTGPRRALLQRLAQRSETLIFYESPRRVTALISDLMAVLGDRPAVLGREMTKPYEEFLRGALSVIQEALARRPMVRGEVTLLVAGAPEAAPPADAMLEKTLTAALENRCNSTADIVRDVARRFGVPRKTVYALALKIRQEVDTGGDGSQP
ncbi:MAG: 16S rRNA (cytidine(1402)-2'-O)-methyltransferase [Deltaproteobacteria bacterium]|nr:16S rRNA (cytidine(1402)-2'-O)-methyltransferase [Deltaproteobacteria bacterium]MBW2355462.1 16S rRNA (cytidine(1402)-2'-O)-methyltransferase [Deltaproteobacteria bacterium]